MAEDKAKFTPASSKADDQKQGQATPPGTHSATAATRADEAGRTPSPRATPAGERENDRKAKAQTGEGEVIATHNDDGSRTEHNPLSREAELDTSGLSNLDPQERMNARANMQARSQAAKQDAEKGGRRGSDLKRVIQLLEQQGVGDEGPVFTIQGLTVTLGDLKGV